MKMKLFVKRIAYKILVILMITVNLSFFCASSVSEAKLKLAEGEFYYSGTQEGSYKVKKGFWENILNILAEIANYLLGIMTLGLRGVVVGWVEIMEILLTALLGVKTDIGAFFNDALSGMDSYSQYIVNVEKIIFNQVPILHANIFVEGEETTVESGDNKEVKNMKKNGNQVVILIKEAVAKWYYVMRLIVIAFMLLLLIFIGIKMALSSIASEKAVYKQMLTDWIAGMIIIFSIHYIMIFILNTNDQIIKALQPLAEEKTTIEEQYQYGDIEKKKTSSEIETTLYESARTRAYSLKLTDGFTGLIIYSVLVYYAWKFALIYFRRLINIIILTLLAPAIAASYAFNKVLTGKSKVFSTWLFEYIMNIIIQIVHAVIYVSFISVALTLSLVSISGLILALALLNFTSKADKLIRQIFKLSGGNGSLSGEMADKTSYKQMREEARSIKNAMVGGILTKAAIKATYGAVTKPAATLGMAALSHAVAANENRKLRNSKEKSSNNETKDAQSYLETDPEAIANLQKIEQLRKKYHSGLTEEQLDELKAKGIAPGDAQYQQALRHYGIDKKEQQKEEAEINKQIQKIEDEIQKGFITQQVSNGDSITGALKGNIGVALRGLVIYDAKKKKYRSMKVNTLREGNVKYTFWRKKIDSKTLRFRQNMKLGKLLGLDSQEQAVLKSEMNFWKSRIVALGSMVAGFPMLAESPLVGMALLINSEITHLNVKTRRRRYKNRVAKLKDKSYTFQSFGPGAIEKLSRPETYHILEMDQLEILKHKKVRKEVSSVLKWAKSQDIREKNIRNKAKDLEKQYIEGMYDYRNEVKKEIHDKSIEDLAFEQKLREKNVVNVGDGICMQLQNNVAMNKLLDEIKDIEARKDLTSQQKTRMIQDIMQKNKNLIITEAITTLCGQQGITDIMNLELTDAQMAQINYTILDMIEKQGIVRKGQIDLEEVEINEETISHVYLGLTSNSQETNQVLEEEIITSAILEYLVTKGEKDIKKLKTKGAQEAIYDIIKEKLMPKSSKESNSVIEKLTGKNKVKEDFELSEETKQNIEEEISKVKKVKKQDLMKNISKEKKQNIVRRELSTRLNQTKDKLENALYTEDDSNLEQKELDLLFLLSNLKNQNAKLDEMGIKTQNKTTTPKVIYSQQSDGSKRFDPSKDGSRRLETKMHGPAVDIIDLINKK